MRSPVGCFTIRIHVPRDTVVPLKVATYSWIVERTRWSRRLTPFHSWPQMYILISLNGDLLGLKIQIFWNMGDRKNCGGRILANFHMSLLDVTNVINVTNQHHYRKFEYYAVRRNAYLYICVYIYIQSIARKRKKQRAPEAYDWFRGCCRSSGMCARHSVN